LIEFGDGFSKEMWSGTVVVFFSSHGHPVRKVLLFSLFYK
jgi:hypothetical protein